MTLLIAMQLTAVIVRGRSGLHAQRIVQTTDSNLMEDTIDVGLVLVQVRPTAVKAAVGLQRNTVSVATKPIAHVWSLK